MLFLRFCPDLLRARLGNAMREGPGSRPNICFLGANLQDISGRLGRAFWWESGCGRLGPKGPVEVGDGPCAGRRISPTAVPEWRMAEHETMSETTLDCLRHPASMRVLTEPPR